MPKKPLSISVLFVIGSFLALALASGCGKKVWPSPGAAAEALALDQTAASWTGSCLGVSAHLAGNPANLERLVLELAPADCPGCPFAATSWREYRPGGPGLVLDQETGRILLTACSLDQAAGVRFRLAAHNIHRTLPPAFGADLLVPPAGRTSEEKP